MPSRAFTVNSIDYILKPVDEKRLLDAIVKYETLKGKDYKQENYIGDLIQSLQKQEKMLPYPLPHCRSR